MKKGTTSIEQQLLGMFADNPDLQNNIKQKFGDTKLVKCLIKMRAKSGLSQAELATRMNCSQSRVSKIEHCDDTDLSFGDILAYTRCTGHSLVMSMTSGNVCASNMIKYHVAQIREQLNKIIELAKDDEEIMSGVDSFSMELLYNICKVIDDATAKIPNSSFQRELHNQSTKDNFVLNCNDERCLLTTV